MKSILSLVAICAVVALAGCNSTKSQAVAPGAVSGKSACCAEKSSGCCADKAKAGAVAPGAVGDKATCTKTCPLTGKTETVSPGAVSEKKAGCCASKSSCTSKSTDGSN